MKRTTVDFRYSIEGKGDGEGQAGSRRLFVQSQSAEAAAHRASDQRHVYLEPQTPASKPVPVPSSGSHQPDTHCFQVTGRRAADAEISETRLHNIIHAGSLGQLVRSQNPAGASR